MHTVEQRLFEWHEIHKALDHARERLRSASSTGARARATGEAEVRKLQRESDSAFAEVQARLADRQRSTARSARGPSSV